MWCDKCLSFCFLSFTSQKEYLLRDSELTGRDGGLRFIERENPKGELWSKMKLYLLCQVQEKSYARYGGTEGLDSEHQRRDDVQQDQKLKRHTQRMSKVRPLQMAAQKSKKGEKQRLQRASFVRDKGK